jgi:hypothetical protein
VIPQTTTGIRLFFDCLTRRYSAKVMLETAPGYVVSRCDEYLEKMEDFLEVYERPYNPKEPVVCFDKKPVALHGDVRLAAKP